MAPPTVLPVDQNQSGAPMSKIQGVTQQETQPESPTPSCLDIDATNPSMQPGIDDIMENAAGNDPYHNFFQFSRSSLAPAPPNVSQKHRLRNLIFIPSLLRPPVSASVRLHECLKRHFFAHRALSDSPVQALGSNNPTEHTLEGKVRTGDEDEEHVDLPDTSSADDPLPPAEPDNNGNGKLSKIFMRVRRKDTTASGKQAAAKITCDPPPEAVEARTGSVSQAGSSSHAGLVHNTSSPMTSGQSSESSHPPLANERISLPQRFKHHFFSQRTGPQPVTVSAARPKKTHGMAPRTVLPANQSAEQGNGNGNGNANAQTVQSSSATVQPAAAHPDLGPYTLQSPQRQVATQASQRDYGCWGNFCLVVGCIDRPVVC
ncbi:hypothetical protein M405DRAFT_812635 [Rhizopogon salebrosus TDB-379]|nr:hypothetical protein M405DRAFT_812635 [Rhizopogon salebrosus TDB-379]